ncbi:hypothetical protein MMPV_003977 [Pyropia vietnamensis]
MKAPSPLPVTILPTDGGASEEAATAFAAALDGEWNGFQAKVDPVTGAALKIPAIEVPDDFAEWNVHPVGYATTSSIKLRKASLYVKEFQLYPTITLDEIISCDQKLVIHDTAADGFALFPSGAYAAGDAAVPTVYKSILDHHPHAEMCLVDAGPVPAPGEEDLPRERMVVRVSWEWETGAIVSPMVVIHETWYVRWCDGSMMEGASGFISGWPAEPPVDAADLAGTWVPDGGGDSETVDTDGLVLLPLGMSVRVDKDADGGVLVEVGWLRSDAAGVRLGYEPGAGDRRMVLRRAYAPDGALLWTTQSMLRRQG